MSKAVFISYCQRQGEWVWHRLKPCLDAGGVEVHIDIERFRAGKDLIVQMDTVQDAADLSLLVLSPEYLASANCQHEMNRAMARDQFVVIKRVDCAIPPGLQKALYVDLRDDSNARQWDLLFQACDADLGTIASDWLNARDEIVRYLLRDISINLVVPRKTSFSKPNWRKLIENIQKDYVTDLGVVDLASGANTARHGLVAEMLQACGATLPVPQEPGDLLFLTKYFEQRPTPAHLALTHFDMVVHRPNYEVNLFAALRYLITDRRKLVLLIQSRTHFVELLPANHPLSSFTNLVTVELHSRP